MSLAEALILRLNGAGAVTALVDDRSSWVTRNENELLPAIVLQQISEERPQHLQGFEDMRTARVQLSALSTRFLEARAALEAAIAALVPEASVTVGGTQVRFWRASPEGIRDTAEEVAGTGLVHRPIADLIIKYAL